MCVWGGEGGLVSRLLYTGSLKGSLSCSGAFVWNSLPRELGASSALNKFKGTTHTS